MQAVHLAVQNNKLIRTRASNATLLQNPAINPSVYDTAIRESGFLYGNRGVEAALADYDATFTSAITGGNNLNVTNSSGAGFVLNQGTTQFTSALAKTFATGGSVSLNNNWNYLGSNQPNLLFPNAYTSLAQVQFTQPLWAYGGVEYNRIAGPARAGLGGVTGVSQGVAISRINTDISIADFENSVVTMVKDVEDLYWELYLAYRQFAADNANRESALRTWREVKAKMTG